MPDRSGAPSGHEAEVGRVVRAVEVHQVGQDAVHLGALHPKPGGHGLEVAGDGHHGNHGAIVQHLRVVVAQDILRFKRAISIEPLHAVVGGEAGEVPIDLAALDGTTHHQVVTAPAVVSAQMTMQAQTEEGAVRLLVVDYRGGELRGYVDFDGERLAGLGANPSLYALFGRGYLAMTFDLAGNGGRYQGVVPVDTGVIAQPAALLAAAVFFYSLNFLFPKFGRHRIQFLSQTTQLV